MLICYLYRLSPFLLWIGIVEIGGERAMGTMTALFSWNNVLLYLRGLKFFTGLVDGGIDHNTDLIRT